MKLVYICSPYAGDIEKNVKFTQDACRYAISQNCAPVAVHLLYPMLLDDTIPAERETGIQMGLRVLTSCEEIWICGDRISTGMKQEIAEAKRMGIALRYVGELEIRMGVFSSPESGMFSAPTMC